METHACPYLLSALESGSVARPGPEPQDLLGTDGTRALFTDQETEAQRGRDSRRVTLSQQKADDLPGVRHGRATAPVLRD